MRIPKLISLATLAVLALNVSAKDFSSEETTHAWSGLGFLIETSGGGVEILNLSKRLRT
jgi:hypothetical protein